MTALRRTTAITATIATALALGVTFPTSAFAAGALTLTATPRTSCNAGQSDPFGLVSNGPAPYFAFHCTSGAFELEADVASPATAGQYADAQTVAPAGIIITSATATGSVFYSNSEWTGDSYSNGGGNVWPNGSTTMADPALSSWYWGYQVDCAAAVVHRRWPDQFDLGQADGEREPKPKLDPGGIRQSLVPDHSGGMGLEPSGRPMAAAVRGLGSVRRVQHVRIDWPAPVAWSVGSSEHLRVATVSRPDVVPE